MESKRERKVKKRRDLFLELDDYDFRRRFRLTKESVVELTLLKLNWCMPQFTERKRKYPVLSAKQCHSLDIGLGVNGRATPCFSPCKSGMPYQ
ncbi:hypothetical protein AVEN_157925-1 [Araneus ventricosus]|uniref:Uncharacterized protein n=1 Tax=Araneus ventricosus TaxID=182803 RepID=A0A4Y2H9H3_ARAVE|nr:hypothetical protein AVEN_157925-1 [Araneus ventricosus]